MTSHVRAYLNNGLATSQEVLHNRRNVRFPRTAFAQCDTDAAVANIDKDEIPGKCSDNAEIAAEVPKMSRRIGVPPPPPQSR